MNESLTEYCSPSPSHRTIFLDPMCSNGMGVGAGKGMCLSFAFQPVHLGIHFEAPSLLEKLQKTEA